MSTRTRWWWVRHAPVTSTEGRIYGNTDPPANVEDPPTYAALARFLPDESTLVTSHLQRTRQTAEAIRAAGLDMPDRRFERHELGPTAVSPRHGRASDSLSLRDSAPALA